MIGHLSGHLILKKPPFILLDVAGVGYECQMPMNDALPLLPGQSLRVWTHLLVKEDAQDLYAFLNVLHRQLFRLLIKITGVGPKMALNIVSGLNLPQFIQEVEQQNAHFLSRLPGIGQKTAEKLILELKDKLKKHPDWVQAALNDSPSQIDIPLTLTPEQNTVLNTDNKADWSLIAKDFQDVKSALLNLGYRPKEAEDAVQAVLQNHKENPETGDLNPQTWIKLALKALV